MQCGVIDRGRRVTRHCSTADLRLDGVMFARLPDASAPGAPMAPANRIFKCHGCKQWINQGSHRTGIPNDANPSGWGHFCYQCTAAMLPAGGFGGAASSGRLHRPVGGGKSAEGEVATRSGGTSSSSQTPRSQSSLPEPGGGTWASDCCAGADGDIDVGEEGKEEGPAEEEPVEVEVGGGRPEEEEPGEEEPKEEEPEEEEPEEGEAKDDDPRRWSSKALQVAMSRSGRAVVDFLPTIAANGSLLPPRKKAAGGKGKGKDTAESSPRDVAAAFRKRFPQAPICHPVASVETRAIETMQPNEATLAMKKREEQGADMGRLLRVSAMSVFATIHVVVALYVHEVVFFEELVGLKPFQASESSPPGRCCATIFS